MEVGGEVITRAIAAIERIAVANEDLIKLAREERDAREVLPEPPLSGGEIVVCPHCLAVNPEIRNEGGTGSIADFALAALCLECQKMFIAEPTGWMTFKNKDDYERRGNGNGS